MVYARENNPTANAIPNRAFFNLLILIEETKKLVTLCSSFTLGTAKILEAKTETSGIESAEHRRCTKNGGFCKRQMPPLRKIVPSIVAENKKIPYKITKTRQWKGITLFRASHFCAGLHRNEKGGSLSTILWDFPRIRIISSYLQPARKLLDQMCAWCRHVKTSARMLSVEQPLIMEFLDFYINLGCGN